MVISYMGVSKNNGTPKSSTFIGFSIINHPFWGTIIFGNTHINMGGDSRFSYVIVDPGILEGEVLNPTSGSGSPIRVSPFVLKGFI